jgi:histidine triad (HIT) family protein
MGCLFCSIIEKKIPSKIVYEDDQVLAFEDIHPQAPVHILIIPRKHISTVLEATPDDNALLGHMFQTANLLARERNIAEDGFRLVMNCNRKAGQTVFHIHLHLLAGRIMRWPPG